MTFSTELCLALLLDLLLGDPPRLPHPVVGVGCLITLWEGWLCPPPQNRGQAFLRGVALWALVVLSTLAAVGALLCGARASGPLFGAAATAYLLCSALAWRSLKDETLPVALALFSGDLPAAREAVSRVVGRDTASLDEAGVVRAAVETVAENSVDGVLSVLFWAALGQALAGEWGMVLFVWIFKAASTMDSMVGYNDERYHDFGRFAARMDDLLNFIPARLGGLVILAAGACLGMDIRGGVRAFLRDRKKHKSPNSAHGESAFAGLLGLSLGGGAEYGGVFEERPWLGDGERTPRPADILRAHKLLDASCALFALLALFAQLLPLCVRTVMS